MKKLANSWNFHRRPLAIDALVVCIALLVNANARAESGTVTRDRSNVRARPSMTAEVVAQLHKGDGVEVLEHKTVADAGKSMDWLRIPLPATAKCFVSAKFLTAGAANADAVHVRCGAGANFREVGKLAKGDKVDVIKTEGDWAQIKPTAHCSAWIAAELVEVKLAAVVPPVTPTPVVVTPEPPPAPVTPPVAPQPAATIRVTDTDPDMSVQYVVKDGILRAVKAAANAPGSYELLTKEMDGLQWRKAYLETTEHNLSKFEGKHVRVMGNARWKKGERYYVIVVDRVDMIW